MRKMGLPLPVTAFEAPAETFLAGLASILGEKGVLTRPEDVVFYSTDISRQGLTAEAVIQPTTIDMLSRALAWSTDHGRHVIPRGGGFSYTGGYLATREPSIIVDLRGLDRIIEINAKDMYVTVECGVTWRALYEALKEKGLRTPYFGPMSGYNATVGGALSQGSFFLGSTQYGTTAETTLGLEVVLADGAILKTGSGANKDHPSPFFRTYGPDLTGLFLGDTGALGFKARATLKLIPFPKHQAFCTFAFEAMASSIEMVSEVGRLGLAGECYCWDPTFVKSVGERTNTLQGVKYLAGVVRSGRSLGDGLKAAARMAMAGKTVFDGSTYLVHLAIDDASDAAAEEKLNQARDIAARLGGGEIEATAPRVTRGTPFTDFNTADLAAGTLRNLPTNSLSPHSKIQELAQAVQTYFASQKVLMDAHGIYFGVIYFAVGNNAMCLEPLIYWHDDEHRHHNRVKQKSDLEALGRFKGRPEATGVVTTLRQGLLDIMTRHGVAHVQIGKSYPYLETRQATTVALLKALKAAVDPRGLVNPGALGLE
jgi:FAD/FMN-containing dehydrogenase